MTDLSEQLRLEEYRALRATIRERGTVRLVVAAVTFSVWAVTILAGAAWLTHPFFGLPPLLVLAAGFEIVFATHTGVERVGRYLQIQHEPASGDLARWERTAMETAVPGSGAAPLFPVLFIAAVGANFVLSTIGSLDVTDAVLAQDPRLLALLGLLHLGAIGRILRGSRLAGLQRARDLAALEAHLRRQ